VDEPLLCEAGPVCAGRWLVKRLFLAGVALLLVAVGLPVIVAGAWAAGESGGCGDACLSQEAEAFDGVAGYADDPTSGGFVTLRMLHVYAEVDRVFSWAWGISCWDEHAWNPSSDHPLGRACDFTVGAGGDFPSQEDRLLGWILASWLRANAVGLGVSYVIFDGEIWSAARDGEGWRVYDGGGVYDPEDPTGGHFDHVHVSVRAD